MVNDRKSFDAPGRDAIRDKVARIGNNEFARTGDTARPSALRKSCEGSDCFDDTDMNAIGCGGLIAGNAPAHLLEIVERSGEPNNLPTGCYSAEGAGRGRSVSVPNERTHVSTSA